MRTHEHVHYNREFEAVASCNLISIMCTGLVVAQARVCTAHGGARDISMQTVDRTSASVDRNVHVSQHGTSEAHVDRAVSEDASGRSVNSRFLSTSVSLLLELFGTNPKTEWPANSHVQRTELAV